MANYAVLDGSNTVVNKIVWDGVAPWSPPGGTTTQLDNKITPAQIGGTYNPGIPDFIDP